MSRTIRDLLFPKQTGRKGKSAKHEEEEEEEEEEKGNSLKTWIKK